MWWIKEGKTTMTVIRPPLATLVPNAALAPEPEIALAPDATPLEFLNAVYRDPMQPISLRMRAAIAAAPFVHPKLTVNANINSGFASRLEGAIEKSGKSVMIDARPVGSSDACP